MNKKFLFTTILTLLLLSVMALPALGQSPVTAEVDRNFLSTDDALVLTVTIDTGAGDAARPTLPTMNDFQILGSSSGTQITVVNGDMTVQETYSYSLRPLREGALVIDPVTVQINGQTYTTDPITVEVTQGTGQPQQGGSSGGAFPTLPGFPNLNQMLPNMPGSQTQQLDPSEMPTELEGQDYFIEAEVDHDNPYQGEELVYTFRFYQAGSLFDQPDYTAPSFTGFWSKELSDQQMNYSTEAAGRPYRVTELQTILVPTVTGEVTIDPAQLSIPGDFFSSGVDLQTQPITVSVQPLPQNAPDSFRGAVGQFEISAATDLTQAEVNDTVTMDVTITGTGNLETMPDPVWTEGPEWRSFDSKATVNAQFVDGKLQGSRTYERVLLPTENGDLVLPAIEFSYFNPVTGQYETKSTEPITVQVTGDVGAGASLAPLDPGTAVPQNAATAAVNPVLRPIKSSAELSSSAASALTEQTGYWLLWVVPLLLLVGHFSWKSYQQRRLDTADLRRSKSAAGKAKKALKEAQNAGLGQEAAGPILTAYMEEKMNRPVAGLSHTQLVNLLSANGVDDDLSRRVQNCLMLSEMGRYAPAELTLKQGDLWSETAAVIDALDTNL
ncbi:MAG: BatD family protein [Candidatus Promineifilaceae bacterium]